MQGKSYNKGLISFLPKVRGRYSADVLLARYVWFQVGGAAEVIYKPADIEDLSCFLREKSADVPVTMVGAGSNLLVRDGRVPGVIVRLGRGFNNIAFHGNEVDVGAGVLDRTLSLCACDEGLEGVEFLSGVPGTIGGALRMNAGCYGSEIKDILSVAFAMDPKGNFHKLTPEELGFSYRECALPEDWIFVGARFKLKNGKQSVIFERINRLLEERELTQPVRSRTGGSTFANPPANKAWELIDKAGCRGLQIGGAQVSEKHCNFLVNNGDATAEDIETLGEEVRRRVLEVTGVDLQWEIKRIGVSAEDLALKTEAA